MLIALLVTVLSASPVPADSVRAAAKQGAVRPDTTLLTMPAPTISAPTQSAPEVVLPIRPVTAVAAPLTRPLDQPARPTGVVQQSAATAAGRPVAVNQKPRELASAPAPTPAPIALQPAPASPVAISAPTSAPTSAPSAPASAPTSTVSTTTTAAVPAPAPAKDSAAVKVPVAAPADAVATAAAEPRSIVTSTRVDPRTVVSVRSSERFEPLYAVPIPSAGLRLPAPTAADSIVVYKHERTLVLYNRGVPIRTYFVALGSKPVGDKERVGDQKTPEGLFYINAHNPASKFHLALRISYPDDAHRARAAAIGADPGGDIMIHGLPLEYSEAGKRHVQNDWTNGCVALSNQEIEEIWHAVPDGTPVQIKP
jgi:hypothetical protein